MGAIYFLPRYIASLKYYEKLFPALLERGMAPAFLLFEDKGMVAHCKERGLPYDARFVSIPLGRVPLISHFTRERAIFRELDTFLDDARPGVLVSEPVVPHRARALFARAKRRGIETLALQWALHTSMVSARSPSLAGRVLALRSSRGSLLRGILYKTYLFFLTLMFRIADLFSGGTYFMHADNHVNYLGVIDEHSRESFAREWGRERIRVVGYAEFTLVAGLVRRLHDKSARAALSAKYGLVSGRRNILVLSTPFYSGQNAVIMNEEGQRGYFGAVFDDIRSAYPQGEATILFKLHPREQNIYGPLEVKGVRVFGNEADLDELVVLSDLYIAHPLTAANFLVRASGTPALFINFTSLAYMNEGKNIHSLKAIATSHEEFRELLQKYKTGRLPIQYDTSGIDTDSLPKIIDFVSGVSRGV